MSNEKILGLHEANDINPVIPVVQATRLAASILSRFGSVMTVDLPIFSNDDRPGEEIPIFPYTYLETSLVEDEHSNSVWSYQLSQIAGIPGYWLAAQGYVALDIERTSYQKNTITNEQIIFRLENHREGARIDAMRDNKTRRVKKEVIEDLIVYLGYIDDLFWQQEKYDEDAESDFRNMPKLAIESLLESD